MSTRPRIYGAELETPFGRWLRAQPSLDAVEAGLAAADVDMHIHKYKASVDGIGTRRVHLMMTLEVKTGGGMPRLSQEQTLSFQHQILSRHRGKLLCCIDGDYKSVWHFGYFVLSMLGTSPDDYEHVTWCRFDERGRLRRGDTLQTDDLVKILRFETDPSTLQPLKLRRHHKTRRIVQVLHAGRERLFDDERVITTRS